MLSRTLRGTIAASALLAALPVAAAYAAPFMIVGDDEKLVWNDQGAAVVKPTGNDNVLIVDLADPENPRIVANLALENSVVGPPVNLAITPDGALGLVADSVTVVQDGSALKQVPTDKLFVIDLKANPPRLAQTVTVGKQPSGLSINAAGDLALVANRASNSVSVLKIAGGKVTELSQTPMDGSVSTVEFTPDGKHALAAMSPANHIALLSVDGDQVVDTKVVFPTYLFPYNVVVTPNGQLALTADNGFGGNADGNADVVSVIDLSANPPRVIDHITVADAPEGLAVSPKGDVAVVASVQGSNLKGKWFYHQNGVITVLKIDGTKVSPIKVIEVGSTPEAVAFTPDGKYLYVGNYLDQGFSILKVDGTDVTDTGKRFKVLGHPASARMG
ncbi:MAG: beta-propeller fold lactonase family protein [Acetobacteraceae bacterium]